MYITQCFFLRILGRECYIHISKEKTKTKKVLKISTQPLLKKKYNKKNFSKINKNFIKKSNNFENTFKEKNTLNSTTLEKDIHG